MDQKKLGLNSEDLFSREFFSRPTLEVAPDLLGAYLCRRLADGTLIQAPIVELEAYTADDPACHAFKGLTKRCQVMFGPAGFSYVYFIYGMYNCLNVVTEPDGQAGAILLRALEMPGGSGPGKLCQTLQITREHNGVDLTKPESPIFLSKGSSLTSNQIGQSIRVGISQAQDRLWRYFVKDSEFLSVKVVKPHKAKSKRKVSK